MWALPRELWELPEQLALADKFLNDVLLLKPLAGCLDLEHGRPSLPVAQVLRLFYLKEQYRLSDEVLIREVSDSIHWRRFCHFGLVDEMPDPSALSKWRHRLGADGIARVNRAITLKLHEERVVRGRKVRVDSTVVDADIHYPTDSGLIADGIKRLTRLGEQVRSGVGGTVTALHDRSRSVKKRLLGIGKLLTPPTLGRRRAGGEEGDGGSGQDRREAGQGDDLPLRRGSGQTRSDAREGQEEARGTAPPPQGIRDATSA